MGMLRFSIGDVTEDRPALFIRLHFIIFWCRRPWTGPPFPSSSSWVSLCWLSGKGVILVQLQGVWANHAGELRWAKAKGWRILVKDGGRAFRLGIHCFLEQYLLQACASSGTRTRVLRSRPRKVIHSEFRIYTYILIHDRVHSEIQAGKPWTLTTSGFPAHFASRTPLETPS